MFQANNFAKCQEAIMVLSDGTTSSLPDLFAELNPDKKVELSRFVNGKIDFSYRFFTCHVLP